MPIRDFFSFMTSSKAFFSVMKFLFLLFSLLPLLAACGPDKNHARIKGEFKNLDNAEFYVYNSESGFEGIDTIRIEGGKFSHDILLKETQVLTLLYPNFSRTLIIAEPDRTIEITSNAEHLDETDVSGTEDNERFSKFRLKNNGRPKADLHLAAAQYIRDNNRTPDGLAAFMQYFAEEKQYDAKEVLQLLDVLRKGMPKNKTVQDMAGRLRPLLENGAKMPLADFRATTLDGKTVSRRDFTDYPLLVVFFASWQGESHSALKMLNRIRRAFPSLRTLVVSLDTDRQKCRDFLKTDSVASGNVVCDGKAFHSPLAQSIGVHRVPGNILVNAAGKVVARDVPKEDLEDEVAKLMKK